MVVKCNKDKFEIKPLNYMTFTRIYIFDNNAYPVSKDSIIL